MLVTFRVHLHRTSLKIAARNNLISKLAGTNRGANATTLRTSALALCYSTAEYCAPVWSDSAHCNLIDTQLKQTVRIITDQLKSVGCGHFSISLAVAA